MASKAGLGWYLERITDAELLTPQQERDLFAATIQALTVTDAHDYFRETWSPDHRLVIITGNVDLTGGDAAPENQILDVFKKSRKVAVSRPVEKKAVRFPYTHS